MFKLPDKILPDIVSSFLHLDFILTGILFYCFTGLLSYCFTGNLFFCLASILFNRLAAGEIEIPDYDVQLRASQQMEKVKAVEKGISEELETINALPAALLRKVFRGVL